MKAWINSLIFSTFSFVLMISTTIVFGQTNIDKAFQHLYKIMDQYHSTFDVYTNQDAAGNNFYPAIIGNYNAISLYTGNSDAQPFGATCSQITYQDTTPPDINWAGIQWMFPDTNWGYWKGYDLRGSERLTFWAKGKTGSEKVEFKLGGVNRPPFYDPSRPEQDSFDLLSTGVLTLASDWKEYSVDLTKKNNFAIYLDGNSGSNNRYFPSGWYNGDFNMIVNPNWSDNPHSGNSCFRVEWNGFSGIDGYRWNGILWQYPDGNWGEESGYDLTGATKLTFFARTDDPGLQVKFFVGIKGVDSCDEVLIEDTYDTLYADWHKYEVDLTGKDLSNVRGGFGFVFDDEHDPEPDGCVFYLDDIQFDRPLSNDLSNVIGGFICVVSKNDNPNGCTFYIDDVRYQLSESARDARLNKLHFLQSYVTKANASDLHLRNTAFIYDNALAMLAFMARDTEEDWRRAELIGRTFVYCQEHDRDFKGQFLDHRLRNAYQAGDVVDPITNEARVPFVWDDRKHKRTEEEINLSTHTGNLAWVMIALLAYHQQRPNSEFLTAAERLGEWIFRNCYDATGPGGYSGGFEGYGHSKVLWKSTEHNLDIYVAFKKLYEITGNQVWLDYAMHAKRFVEAMWNPDGRYLWVGTLDPVRINKNPLVLDAQTWALMAFRDRFYRPAIEWAKDSLRVNHHNFSGFDFNTDHDGIWFEGTAQMVVAFPMIEDISSYNFYLNELRRVQATATNGDGQGIVAACHDCVSTGLAWCYLNRLHIGATAWYTFAELMWNPYWQESVEPVTEVEQENNTGLPPLHFELLQNYPNPFNPSTRIRFSLPKAEKISLQIYSANGQLVRTLVEDRQSTGTHEVEWDGRDQDGRMVASGLYFVNLSSERIQQTRKVILIR